jgi:hypothetical protein
MSAAYRQVLDLRRSQTAATTAALRAGEFFSNLLEPDPGDHATAFRTVSIRSTNLPPLAGCFLPKVRHRSNCLPLEHKLQTKLKQACRACLDNASEAGRSQVRDWECKVRVIRHVEALEAELQQAALR